MTRVIDQTADPQDVMTALLALHQKLRLPTIKSMAGGWRHKLGPWEWSVSTTGHDHDGTKVEPYMLYVTYNGWPAGLLDPVGSGTFAAGDGANVNTFVAAVRAEIEKQ